MALEISARTWPPSGARVRGASVDMGPHRSAPREEDAQVEEREAGAHPQCKPLRDHGCTRFRPLPAHTPARRAWLWWIACVATARSAATSRDAPGLHLPDRQRLAG